ncbi:WD repeat-containing protein 48 [Mycena venus]|uniref:WD repeat-containing protein 48 n=1 Tax=Mycena venus TaxID=2733690 RepID=A0A8H7D8H5_9AGAR|nr:WD repeat-containing protein 48 [Mycena venus]
MSPPWQRIDDARLVPARSANAYRPKPTGSTILSYATTTRQTLVSASSDGTVQAWKPRAPGIPDPTTVGTHSGYVRCVAVCRTQNWIASGSFDRTIKLWDLTCAQSNPNPDPLITHPADPHAAKSLVYALAADPCGHAVTSGGPEHVVCMWDPRTGKRIGVCRILTAVVLSYEGDDDGAETRYGIPYTNLMRLTSPNGPFHIHGASGDGVRDRDAEVATLYSAASIVSVPLLHLLLYQSASTASHSGHVLMSPLRSALDKIDITTSCI